MYQSKISINVGVYEFFVKFWPQKLQSNANLRNKGLQIIVLLITFLVSNKQKIDKKISCKNDRLLILFLTNYPFLGLDFLSVSIKEKTH